MALAAALASALIGGQVYRAQVEAGGARVAVWRYVASHTRVGPPVLLIPELGFDRRLFDLHGHGLARTLQARGHEVLVLEWRGTGTSSAPLQGMGGLQALFEGDAKVALELAGDGAQIIGVGLGGAAAYLLAGDPANRVRAVVAVSVPAAYEVPNEAVRRLREAVRKTPASTAGPIDLQQWSRLPALVREGREDLYQLVLEHGTRAAELRGTLGKLAPELVEDVGRWMDEGDLPRGRKLASALGALRTPLLVVAAPRDNLVHLEHALAVRQLAPDAPRDELVLQKIEGWPEDAGHLALQAPWAGALYQKIADWLEAH